jgi:hypothetical protein
LVAYGRVWQDGAWVEFTRQDFDAALAPARERIAAWKKTASAATRAADRYTLEEKPPADGLLDQAREAFKLAGEQLAAIDEFGRAIEDAPAAAERELNRLGELLQRIDDDLAIAIEALEQPLANLD